jgi:hypothetical protein
LATFVSDRVTRCVCEKKSPKCSPSHILSKLVHM